MKKFDTTEIMPAGISDLYDIVVSISDQLSNQKVITGKDQLIKKITETLVNHFNTKVVWGKYQLTRIVPILINQIVAKDEYESKHEGA